MRKNTVARNILIYIVFFIPAAAFVFFCLLPDYALVILSVHRWQPVQAVVESTEVKYSLLRSLANRDYRYEPLVHYRFTVNGVRYEGSHITYPAGERYRSDAVADIRDFYAGQNITAYYDPLEPATGAILKPSYLWLYFPLSLTVAVMIGTLCCIFAYIRKNDLRSGGR